MKIRTTYDHPPIPVRSMDWSAIDEDTYDGSEDSATRGQIGRGATELEAVADLLEKLGWEEPPMPPIQEQIEHAFALLRNAFAERTGRNCTFDMLELKLRSGSTPNLMIYLTGGKTTVSVHSHDVGDRTIDAAIAMAHAKIAALRTIDDENADLGINTPKHEEVA